MPSRIQPATSSAIAAASSTWATLRRIRSRSERIFAITGSAEMPSAVPMNSAKTSRSVVAADEGARAARAPSAMPASTGITRLPIATRAGRAAEAPDQREIGLEPGQDRAAGTRRSTPARRAARAAADRPGTASRASAGARWPSTLGPSSRPAASSPITRGLADRAHRAAERARGEQQREQLEPEDQKLVLARHGGGGR